MTYDAIVIGGGFYGLRIALHLRTELLKQKILILEREDALMNRASYVNQARIHNGYHYPRSILTALRSRVNLPQFKFEFEDAVVDNFEHYYAIASRLSKTNTAQFKGFCKRIEIFEETAAPEIANLFNPSMISSVHLVHEPAFDSRVIREILLQRVTDAGGIDVLTGAEVLKVSKTKKNQLNVSTTSQSFVSDEVFNATYSAINNINNLSSEPTFSLQHELTEMPLVEMPNFLKNKAFTVMDGPFFSLMPFPSRQLHTFSHVRYTPHFRWFDRPESENLVDPRGILSRSNRTSNFHAMRADAMRFMPALRDVKQLDSIWDTKTVLTSSESNDSRPILHRESQSLRGFSSIMGGKLDNVYDVLESISESTKITKKNSHDEI